MNILVWVELEGTQPRKVSLQLLSQAARMAGAEGSVFAVAIGPGAVVAAAGEHRLLADKWFIASGGTSSVYDLAAWAGAVHKAADLSGADLVLGGATVRGREIFSFISAGSGFDILADAVRIDARDGAFFAARPVLGGRALKTLRASSKPALATARPNTFVFDPMLPPRKGGSEEFALEHAGTTAGSIRYFPVESVKSDRPPLNEADVVVTAGRGLKEASNMKLVEDLADALGAAVGVTRAVVYAGWRDVSQQIGKSGITVSPRLYVAAGVSGAVHHIMGMDRSKVVVAIDKDPEALMFANADYGIVGDALELLPEITKEVMKARE